MRQRPRPIRRAVFYLPNGFTLFNLFCGIFAIVLSQRGNFAKAALFVFVGGIADALDGRVARATGSGSRIGEELDSLVDAISFGFAPAMIMYFAVLNRENWEWLFVFIFTACAVLRLARFNVEQAGRPKNYFHGLPSPAAGLTLATYYWFSQTPLYSQAVILFTDNRTLAELPWHGILPGLMGLLAILMVSNVPYPAVPTIGWRSPRQIVASLVLVAAIVGLIVLPRQFFFPALLAYVLYGALKWLVLGLVGVRAEPEDVYFQPDLEEYTERPPRPTPRRPTPVVPSDAVQARDALGSEATEPVRRRRRRRRRPDGPRGERSDTARGEHSDSARDERTETQRGGRPESQRGARPERPAAPAPSSPTPPREDNSE